MTALDSTTSALRTRRTLGHLRYAKPDEMKHITMLATPIALVAAVNMAISITDTLMVARLGPETMAAVAVGSDFYSIIFYLASGLLSGLCPAYAEASAQSDVARLRRLRTVGWAICLAVFIPACPLIWFAPIYLGHAGLDHALLAEGSGYTRVMAFTILPMLAVGFLRNRLTAIEKPKLILKVTLTMIPLNAVFNWILIFGIADLPGLGATGAGIATFLTACTCATGLAIIAMRHGDTGLSGSFDAQEFQEAIRVGWPIGIATLAEVGVFLGATLFIAAIAPTETAAHALVLRLAGLTYAIPAGLMQASLVRMARLGPEHHILRRRHTITSAFSVAFIGGIGLLIALGALAMPLAGFALGGSSPDADLMRIGVVLILILAVIELVEPVGTASAGLLRGLRDTRVPMWFSLIGNWGVSMPLAIVLCLVLDWGATGVWTAMGLGNIVASLLITSRLAAHWNRRSSG